MITHLEALQAKTTPLRPTFLFRASGATVPVQYLVWQAPGWGAPDELPVCGDSETLDTPLRLMARAATGTAVSIILRDAHALLSPGLLPAPLTVAGRYAHIRWVRSEFIAIDTDAYVTGADVQPAYGIDTYHLISQRS